MTPYNDDGRTDGRTDGYTPTSKTVLQAIVKLAKKSLGSLLGPIVPNPGCNSLDPCSPFPRPFPWP
jgi:hypothetical protein